MTYYIKGGSRFNAANPTVWVALNLVGFADSKYLDANWKQIDYESIIDTQDPFWLLGSISGGAKEAEFGLYNDYRFKADATGLYGWNGSSWTDILALGGASALGDLTDVVITGPADNELLAWDNATSKWINQTPAEAGLSDTSHNHNLNNLAEKNHASLANVSANQHISNLTDIPTRNHNDLLSIDAGDINHLTDAQVAALHAIYTDVAAVAAVATADDYIKNDANDIMGGDLTVNNLITAGLVDGKDVSGLCTTAEAHAYIEANALVITGGLQMSGVNITMAGAETVDGVDISALSITNMPTAVNNWKMYCTDGAGVMTEFGLGDDGDVLTSTGTTSAPGWEAAGAPGAHTHDGDTLQLDGVNSNGGAFPFTTTGAVTFNQNIAMGANEISGVSYYKLTAAVGNGVRFWNGASAYSIYMSSVADGSYGGRIDTASDYNMYFVMAGGTNRGFQFCDGLKNPYACITPDESRFETHLRVLNAHSFLVYSAGNDKYIQMYHNDVDADIFVSSGSFNIKASGDIDDFLRVYTVDNIPNISAVGGAAIYFREIGYGAWEDVYADLKDQASSISVNTFEKIKAVQTMPDGKIDYSTMPSEIEITEVVVENEAKETIVDHFTDVGDMMYYNFSAVKEIIDYVELLENRIKDLEGRL